MPRIQTITLPNSVTLQYRETGDPNGEPVILLHGVSDSLHTMAPFSEALPSAFRVIAVTQRGHGDSSKPASGYGSADFAGDIARLADALDLPHVHLVGHSMGGWVSLRFADLYASRVASLTLLGAVDKIEDNPAGEEVAQIVASMTDAIDPAFVREFQQSTCFAPVPPGFIDMAVEESLKMPAHVWRACFAAFLAERPANPDPVIPAMLLYGEKDGFLGEPDRKRAARLFRAPKVKVYADLGHALHWEAPERIAAETAHFISDWVRRPVSAA